MARSHNKTYSGYGNAFQIKFDGKDTSRPFWWIELCKRDKAIIRIKNADIPKLWYKRLGGGNKCVKLLNFLFGETRNHICEIALLMQKHGPRKWSSRKKRLQHPLALSFTSSCQWHLSASLHWYRGVSIYCTPVWRIVAILQGIFVAMWATEKVKSSDISA